MGQVTPIAKGFFGSIGSGSLASQKESLKRQQQEEEKKAERERIEAERARFGGGGGVSLLQPSNKSTLG
jgi:hypothetical protein